MTADALPPERAEPTTLTLWALGHGLASLWLDGQLDKRGTLFGTTAAALVDSVVDGIPGFLGADPGAPPVPRRSDPARAGRPRSNRRDPQRPRPRRLPAALAGKPGIE